MKNILVSVIAMLVLAGCHESLENRAAREAKEYTDKNCPTPTVNNTRMDSIAFDKETHTISYYYTLCNTSDNAEIINRESDKLKKALLDGVKESTHLKAYKEAGFHIRYVYHSEKQPRQTLFEVVLTSKDYSL